MLQWLHGKQQQQALDDVAPGEYIVGEVQLDKDVDVGLRSVGAELQHGQAQNTIFGKHWFPH